MGLMETGPGETGPADATHLVQRSEALAREALRHYDFSPRSTLEVITLADHVTLRIDDPVNDERAAMRLHAPGRHHITQIKSELQWLDALLAARTVDVPPPISARNGDRVVTIDDGLGERHVTVCGWLKGRTPQLRADPTEQFGVLGAVAARLHEQVARWALPPASVVPPGVSSSWSGPVRRMGRGGRDWVSTLPRTRCWPVPSNRCAPSSRPRPIPRRRTGSCTPTCGSSTSSSMTGRTARSCAFSTSTTCVRVG